MISIKIFLVGCISFIIGFTTIMVLRANGAFPENMALQGTILDKSLPLYGDGVSITIGNEAESETLTLPQSDEVCSLIEGHAYRVTYREQWCKKRITNIEEISPDPCEEAR